MSKSHEALNNPIVKDVVDTLCTLDAVVRDKLKDNEGKHMRDKDNKIITVSEKTYEFSIRDYFRDESYVREVFANVKSIKEFQMEIFNDYLIFNSAIERREKIPYNTKHRLKQKRAEAEAIFQAITKYYHLLGSAGAGAP